MSSNKLQSDVRSVAPSGECLRANAWCGWLGAVVWSLAAAAGPIVRFYRT